MRFTLFLLKHKWYVFLAGLFYTKANIFDLIVHDWNKFLPSQFKYYNKKHINKNTTEDEIIQAWLFHQNFNKHHWEFWIARTTHGNQDLKRQNILIEIPERYVREMIADWFGAHRSCGGFKEWPDILNWEWMKSCGVPRMKNRIHPKTIKLIDKIFEEILLKQRKISGQHHKNIFSKYLENYKDE